MSDLEQRLTETLTRYAEDAPDVAGLAGAARGRARRRRRSRLAAAAAGLAVVVGGAGAVAVWPDGSPPVATDAAPTGGWRWESWHGVTVQVPGSWGHGSLSGWCADGGTTDPRVEVPGGVAVAIGCTPASAYGLTFQAVDGPDSSWPVVHQDGDAWPAQNAVGGRTVGGVLVTVAAPTAAVAQAVLDTVTPIGPNGDPNGCSSSRGEAPVEAVPTDTMSVCRYDTEGALEASEQLTGSDAARALAALEAAPTSELSCLRDPTEVEPLVRLRTADLHANVDLAGSCAGVRGLGSDRVITADVLYWALSPGFTGPTTGLPLPAHLREE